MANKTNQNKNNLSNKQKWLWILTIFVFGWVIGFLIFIVLSYNNLLFGGQYFYEKPAQTEKSSAQCQNCVRRFIDGSYIEPGKENLFPAAVIIENHIDARPQAGLSKANLIYEAEAEGGITRFLAIFASGEEIDKIGPVRSARPYFVDWAKEFSALFAHCGGSPESLAKINKENIFNLNEFYNENYFWRDKSIKAPHNIFTSSDLLNEYIELRNKSEGKFLSWSYKDDEILKNRPEENKISIGFKRAGYMVEWKYDKYNNEYIRYNGGEIHKTAEDDEIRAKNIIIEYVNAKVIDEEGRLRMEHVGEGKAVICLDGKCEEGEWVKSSASARARFYKNNGEEFKFNAGTTWIEVVRPKIEVKY